MDARKPVGALLVIAGLVFLGFALSWKVALAVALISYGQELQIRARFE